MDSLFICLRTDTSEDVIQLDSDTKDAALYMPFIKSCYDPETGFGYSPDNPITIANIELEVFDIILQFIKLKMEIGLPFSDTHIYYKHLLGSWDDLLLSPSYLDLVSTYTPDILVKCLAAADRLALHELYNLFLYRMIYLQHKFDTCKEVIDAIHKASHCTAHLYCVRIKALVRGAAGGSDDRSRERSKSI